MATAKEKSVYNSFIKKYPGTGLPKNVEKFKRLFHLHTKWDKDTFAFDLVDSIFQGLGGSGEWLFLRLWPREDLFFLQEYNFLKPRREKLLKVYFKSRSTYLTLWEAYEKAKQMDDEKILVKPLKETYKFLIDELIPEIVDAARVVKEGWISKSKQSHKEEDNAV